MSIIKPSEAFPSADWTSGDVRSYMKDQTPIAVDTVADVNDNDFEQARWLFVKANGSYYRLNLSSVAADDGDGVLHDNVGRRYQKLVSTGAGSPWDVQVANLAARAAYDGQVAGYSVLVSDVGDGRAAVYTKNSGVSADWSAPAYFTGLGLDGAPGSSNVVGTSTTSRAIGTGSKSFTIVETNRGWGVGARLRASSDANPSNFMEGIVASYSGTSLTLTVDLVGGSGTHADWTINLAGEPGDISSSDTDASGFSFVNSAGALANSTSTLPSESVVRNNPAILVTAAGASAARLLADRFAFIMQAEDFGCVGDDSAANATPLANAVAAFGSGGGILQFGRGIYRLSSVTVNKPIVFQGQGHKATMLKSTTLTGDVLTMTSPGACAKDIRFDATGNRTSGAYIAATGLHQTHFERLYFTKYYRGIVWDGCVSSSISQSDFRDGTPHATAAESAGMVYLGTVNTDCRVDCVTMDAAAGSQPGHGIWQINTDALQMVNVDIIHHGYALDQTPGNGQSVAATYAVLCYFDNSGMGIRMLTSGTGTILRGDYIAVWSSSHTSNGLEITAAGGAISAINFIGCQMLFNGSRGALVQSGADIHFLGGDYNDNTIDGIAFGSGVTDFSVQSLKSRRNGGQGIYLVGSNDNYQIIGNDLRSNSGEALLGHQGNTGTRITHSNLGIPEVALTRQIVTVQGSNVALTNNITTAQSIFASANDAITLLASTSYRFRAVIHLNTGVTSHTTAFGFGGTATFTSCHYVSRATSSAADTLATPQMRRVSAATASVLTAASTAVTTDIEIEGVIRINGAGTVIPQVTFSAGPTGTCEVVVDSFIEFEPIGSNTVAAVARAA